MGKFLSKKVIPVLGSSIVVASMTAAVASADGVPGQFYSLPVVSFAVLDTIGVCLKKI